MMQAFDDHSVGEWAQWDATGRINVLSRLNESDLQRLAANGLREVALGIESGSERMLKLIDKRITPEMTRTVIGRLIDNGISVKGYFILGLPTETCSEVDATVSLVHDLWKLTADTPAMFRASVFEYRPYPGTPDWHRLVATGKYTEAQLLNYSPVDLTGSGVDEAMRERDEFNFSVNLQLSDAPTEYVRQQLTALMHTQYDRKAVHEAAGRTVEPGA
jgi:anaerobic magnesium-protoporphyrin IX monomethyl ester cyclase